MSSSQRTVESVCAYGVKLVQSKIFQMPPSGDPVLFHMHFVNTVQNWGGPLLYPMGRLEQSHLDRRKVRHRGVDQPVQGTAGAPVLAHPQEDPRRARWLETQDSIGQCSGLCGRGQGLPEIEPRASPLLGTSNHVDRILL